MRLTPEECHPMPRPAYPMPEGECLFYMIEYRPEVPCHVVLAFRESCGIGEVFDASTEERCEAWIQQQLIHMRRIGIAALFIEQSTHWEGIAYLYTNPTRYPVGHATWDFVGGWEVTLPNEEEE